MSFEHFKAIGQNGIYSGMLKECIEHQLQLLGNIFPPGFALGSMATSWQKVKEIYHTEAWERLFKPKELETNEL